MIVASIALSLSLSIDFFSSGLSSYKKGILMTSFVSLYSSLNLYELWDASKMRTQADSNCLILS